MMMCKALVGAAQRTWAVSFWLRSQSEKDRLLAATGCPTVTICNRAIKVAGVRWYARTDSREIFKDGHFVSAGDFVISQALPAHQTTILEHPVTQRVSAIASG